MPFEIAWEAVRDEAQAVIAARHSAPAVSDVEVIPLWPGVEAQGETPILTRILKRTPSIRGAVLSVLAPGKKSRQERPQHWTGLVCLQAASGHIAIGGARHDLRDGEALLLPPAMPREAVNDGNRARILLLLMLDPPVPALKQLTARLLGELLGAGRGDLLRALASSELAEKWSAYARTLRQSFPDLELHIDQIVVEGGVAVCFWRAAGTQAGYFYNVPATQARVVWSGTARLWLRDGKLADLDITYDVFRLLQQLRAALRR